jgi:hypothetical protein
MRGVGLEEGGFVHHSLCGCIGCQLPWSLQQWWPPAAVYAHFCDDAGALVRILMLVSEAMAGGAWLPSTALLFVPACSAGGGCVMSPQRRRVWVSTGALRLLYCRQVPGWG